MYYFTRMSCPSVISTVTLILCFVSEIKTVPECTEDAVMPGIFDEQIEGLAYNICMELVGFDGNMDDSLHTSCTENFKNSTREISPEPARLEFSCRTKTKASFSIKPMKLTRLVLVTPDYGYTAYTIAKSTVRHGVIEVIDEKNYTFWTTILHNDGTLSKWHRGPDLPPWNPNATNVTVEDPRIIYDDISKTYNVTFKLNITSDINACTSLEAINVCNGQPNGGSTTKQFMVNQSEIEIEFNKVPINDRCFLTVIFNQDWDNTLEKKYTTPTPENMHQAEKVENITLDATPTGIGWDVLVSWSPPKIAPNSYALIYEANKTKLFGNQSGSSTNYTFHGVLAKDGEHFQVSVWSIAANGSLSSTRRGQFPTRPSYQAIIIMGTCTVVLIVSAAGIGVFIIWWRKRRLNVIRQNYMFTEKKYPKDCIIESLIKPRVKDKWELEPDTLILHELIGEGAFGRVKKGTLISEGKGREEKEVAVKMLKEHPTEEEIRSFRAEMELMKSVGNHPHIVSLVGCCTRRLLIVSEYCSRGDLCKFLRRACDLLVAKRDAKYSNINIEGSDYRNDLFKNQKDSFPHHVVNKLYGLEGIYELTAADLLSFCRQIAKGMEFLASNRVVHRDLAARNILVTADRTLKIADFGLSRDVYEKNHYKQNGNGKMPFKWMALESLTRGMYTTQSDVWSFGVVIWEVVTLGSTPYPGLSAKQLPEELKRGYRMPCPYNCSKQLYDLMLSCWRKEPLERPTFSDLHRALDDLLNSECPDEYLSLELDDETRPTPKPLGYIRMILSSKCKRVWSRESYERPLRNHYSTPPHSTAVYQPARVG